MESGTPASFRFAVGLGAADTHVYLALREHLGVGHIIYAPRRQAHYDDEVCFAVRSLPELVGVIVPFMDEHLPPSYKRIQYEVWRTRCSSTGSTTPSGSGHARSRAAIGLGEPSACVVRTTTPPSGSDGSEPEQSRSRESPTV
ncbi:hypothetical protein BH20ACT1_BH20ACT1_00550 [soil metagenome]